MKHLLSILIFFSFVSVAFTSCSPNPQKLFEKCADSRLFLDNPKNKMILLGEERYTEKVREHIASKKKPLEEKMESYAYKSKFQMCEFEFTMTPETFKAKWK